jgi:hypothetical protein
VERADRDGLTMREAVARYMAEGESVALGNVEHLGR